VLNESQSVTGRNLRRQMMTDRDNTATLTLTQDEVSTLKRLLIREEVQCLRGFPEEAAELTALRMKIHDQQ